MKGNVDVPERDGVSVGIVMDLLTPKIADMTSDGVSLSGDLTSEELGLDDTDVSIQGTLAVGLDFRAIERTICVTGVVEGTAVRQCVRCLKDFVDPIAFSVRVAYERAAKTTALLQNREDLRRKKEAPGIQSEPDYSSDDLYYYTGDHLELAPMLREQLILFSPMHPLCGEDCRGLCGRCGKDLNEGLCHCGAEPARGPFEVLRRVKQKLRDSADP